MIIPDSNSQEGGKVELPAVLFDGYYVYSEGLTDAARVRTSPENVSDVLDAVVRLLRASPTPSQEGRSPLSVEGDGKAPAISEEQFKKLSAALRLVQEMWDELHRRKLNPILMRQYANALDALESDFKARLPADVKEQA